VAYLRDVLWDKQGGGFYWGLDDDGRVTPAYGDDKRLYGIAFCIYGAAAAYQATQDAAALDLARRGFRWIEDHAHDASDGGYFESLTRQGDVIRADPGADQRRRPGAAPFPPGYKSMNTHIHLLEAFTQLYAVWPDGELRRRLTELLAIVRDKVCVEPGVMNLYFTTDWHAVPDHDSYGHDIETAYLMLEAEEVLGAGHAPGTERMARMLVDHALLYGWDEAHGGFFREGTAFGEPEDRRKEWWVQMEGLNALLLMHEKYGGTAPGYFAAFQRQWQFIERYQIDREYRGVYEMVDADGTPARSEKGQIWKAAYHDARALLNVTERLRRLAGAAPASGPRAQ
jgi:mannobiose 2-epimerase